MSMIAKEISPKIPTVETINSGKLDFSSLTSLSLPPADRFIQTPVKVEKESYQDFIKKNREKLEGYSGQTQEFRTEFEAKTAEFMRLPEGTKIGFTTVRGGLFRKANPGMIEGSFTLPDGKNSVRFELPTEKNDKGLWIAAQHLSLSGTKTDLILGHETPLALQQALVKSLSSYPEARVLRISKLAGDEDVRVMLMEGKETDGKRNFQLNVFTLKKEKVETKELPVLFVQDRLWGEDGGVVITMLSDRKKESTTYGVYRYSGIDDEKETEKEKPKELKILTEPKASTDGSVKFEVKDLGTVCILGQKERTDRFPIEIDGKSVPAARR